MRVRENKLRRPSFVLIAAISCLALTGCSLALSPPRSGILAAHISIPSIPIGASEGTSGLALSGISAAGEVVLVGYIIEEDLLRSGNTRAAEAFGELEAGIRGSVGGAGIDATVLTLPETLAAQVRGVMLRPAAGPVSHTFGDLPAGRRYLIAVETWSNDGRLLPYVAWDYVRVPEGTTALVELRLADDLAGFAAHLELRYGYMRELPGLLEIGIAEGIGDPDFTVEISIEAGEEGFVQASANVVPVDGQYRFVWYLNGSLLEGQETSEVSFEIHQPGLHTLSVVVSSDTGTVSASTLITVE